MVLLVLLDTENQHVTSGAMVLLMLLMELLMELHVLLIKATRTHYQVKQVVLLKKACPFLKKACLFCKKGCLFLQKGMPLSAKLVHFFVADPGLQQLSPTLLSREAFPVCKRPASVVAPTVAPVVVCCIGINT